MKTKSLLAALLLTATSLASHAVGVRLDTVGVPTIGQSFDLQLWLDQPFATLPIDEELLSFGFRLDFDKSRLSLASFAPAAGWDDDSAFLGAGSFGASVFPGIPNEGQAALMIATLHFDALAAGVTTVKLITDAGNLNHGLNYLWAGALGLQASRTLAVAAPVPEPATVLMMAAGLAALVGLRRQAGASTRRNVAAV